MLFRSHTASHLYTAPGTIAVQPDDRPPTVTVFAYGPDAFVERTVIGVAEIDALGRIWKKVYKTGFVEIEYNYFSVDLPQSLKKHRRELIDKYNTRGQPRPRLPATPTSRAIRTGPGVRARDTPSGRAFPQATQIAQAARAIGTGPLGR